MTNDAPGAQNIATAHATSSGSPARPAWLQVRENSSQSPPEPRARVTLSRCQLTAEKPTWRSVCWRKRAPGPSTSRTSSIVQVATLALKEDQEVRTKSKGEGSLRKVVIYPVKKGRNDKNKNDHEPLSDQGALSGRATFLGPCSIAHKRIVIGEYHTDRI